MASIRKPRLAELIQFDGPGGGPVSVGARLLGLRDAFDCWVLCDGRGRLAALCEAEGIPRVHLPIRYCVQWPWGAVRLIRALRHIRPDLLVLEGQWGGVLGALVARAVRIPVVVYIAHWPAFYTDWDPIRLVRNFLAERISCRLSHRVIVLSESNRAEYLVRRHADESRLVTLPNPVDLGRIPSEAERVAFRRVVGWTERELHVVSACRLADQKRVDWLLRAWPRVMTRVPQARLWIVGDGPQRGPLERLAERLKILDTCHFVGAVPDGRPYLAAADVVVATSLYESFGYSVVEAMACGRPIVATAADGLRDALRDGVEGFLVPVGDVDGIADRLIRLLTHPTLRITLGEAGRRTAQRYAADCVVPKYRDLFLSMVADRRRRASEEVG